MRQILALLLLGAAAAAPLAAQSARPTPPRPLLASADTNDASAYYSLGVSKLSRQPAEAAAAFYWAGRLRPEWAEAHYAQRVALLLTDKNRLINYIQGVRRARRSPEEPVERTRGSGAHPLSDGCRLRRTGRDDPGGLRVPQGGRGRGRPGLPV